MKTYKELQYNDDFTICHGPVNPDIQSACLHPNCIKIEAYAFNYCKNLKEIEINENLVYIEDRAFEGSGIEKIDFSKTKNGIVFMESVFNDCANLKEVMLESKSL